LTRVLRLLDPLFRIGIVGRLINGVVRAWSSAAGRNPTTQALRDLLVVEDLLLRRAELLAIDLEGGIHPKHRIMRYHDFFVDRIGADERVLDVGCGKGELAFDLAERAGAHVTGIDISEDALAFARERFHSDRLELELADAFEWVPPQTFDVIVISNMLEHVEERVGLLRRLVELARPKRFLIRVPVLERDWVVLLRKELNLPYFADPSHFTEYSSEQLTTELTAAGLEPSEVQQRWGELWAVATVASGDEGILAR
jgi:SAM-dependent methyltransferase